MKTIQYFIISPDGFPTQPEPFTCEEENLQEHSIQQFELWKERYTQQGYYSANAGRISLEDLDQECSIERL